MNNKFSPAVIECYEELKAQLEAAREAAPDSCPCCGHMLDLQDDAEVRALDKQLALLVHTNRVLTHLRYERIANTVRSQPTAPA